MVVLWASGLGSLSGMDSNAVTSSFADVFMLQSVLWAPTVPNVTWSLAYEMVFYLLITALFLAGVHRRSGSRPTGSRPAADPDQIIRRGCHFHAVPATWMWHPRLMRAHLSGPLAGS